MEKYKVDVKCNNCGEEFLDKTTSKTANEEKGEDKRLEIEMGVLVSKKQCPKCGCISLHNIKK